MTDETEYRQAVLDTPDDDAPRLAYANWCDAQGDELHTARATLIRAQIELADMDPADMRGGRANDLRQSIQELRDRHGSTWGQPLAGWVDTVHFVRGFIGWIELSARRWLDHAAQIRAFAPVQHLDLTGVRDVDESLADSPTLVGIRSLAMDGCGLHDLHVQLLAASPHVTDLRWLSLADNHLGLPAAEALAASTTLPRLSFVELRSNPVDPTEQLGYDGEIVVATSMPPEGRDLEARFGPQAWLHHEDAPGRFDRARPMTQPP